MERDVPTAEGPPDVATICSDLIRIDTSNPGGLERPAAEYVAGLLADLGLEPEIIEEIPGRSNVVARLAGEESALPGMLVHAHLDSVPAQRSEWTVDPWSGHIADGFVWGRGAVDMKNAIAMTLAALRRLRDSGTRPRRNLLLAFTSDEELGGQHGARFLVEHHAELFEGCGVGIGEVGGFDIPRSDGQPVFIVSTVDKGIRQYSLGCKGTSGHASMLSTDNSVVHLAHDLVALSSVANPVHVIAPMAQLIHALDPTATMPEGAIDALRRTGPISRMLIPGLVNSVAVTQLRAGYTTNVIPGDAWASIDCRFLPGFEDELQESLQTALGASSELTLDRRSPPAVTEADSWFEWIAASLVKVLPDAVVAPYVFSGSTDAKWFAQLGIPTFGFTPMRLPPAYDFSAMFHGADERVPISALEFGVGVLAELYRS
jgi:acetylornithine deacetylase/succinyl-diaminopimelate desuccinylase-like protein